MLYHYFPGLFYKLFFEGIGVKVLLVEDDESMSKLACRMLERGGYTPDPVLSAEEGIDKAECGGYGIIISDIVLPGMSGLEMLAELKSKSNSTPVILLTAHKEFDYAVQAMRLGASSLILKPFTYEELIEQIKRITNLNRDWLDRKPALRHIISQEHAMVFDTATLMKKENLFATATYLSEQFGTINDRGMARRLKYRLAIHEALRNGVEHGNLEMDSNLKSKDGLDGFCEKYDRELQEKLKDPKYSSRKIICEFTRFDDEISLSITDEGSGFDHKNKFKQLQNGNRAIESHGRGFLLIVAYMDEVLFNDVGNKISLVRLNNKHP